MRILAFGTYDVVRHPRVQIVLDGFRANGDEVEECNVPLGFDTDARVEMVKRPWRLAFLAARVLRTWVTLWRRSRRVGPFDAVFVGYLGHLDVHLARRRWPRAPIVLDYFISMADTAADRGIGAPPVRRLLRAFDKAATRACDVAIVDTPAQASTVLAPPRTGAVVPVPIGTPTWWFVPSPRVLPPAPLRVVFFALFTPLQGAPTIARAGALLADEPGVEITMIGGGQDLAEAQRLAAPNPRVTLLPPAPPESLVDVAAGHHVCLGIFGTGPKALRVVPNKIYQGAAAGCALVTSDTGPQREMLGDAAVYVPPGDAEALAGVLRDLARDPARVEALRRAAYDLAQARFRPERVVEPLRERLLAR